MADLQLVALDAIQEVVSPQLARDVVRRALRCLADDEVVPVGTSLEISRGEVHVKGARLTDSPYIGFKFACGFPGNISLGLATSDGFSVALDACTGRLVALLLDQGWLTQMRTAAASAVAADLLARPDASSVALIGAGEQASFVLTALREVRRVRDVRVWNRSGQRAQQFAADYTRPGSVVTVVENIERAVRNADLVVTVTASCAPLIDAAWLRPGTHVTAVGSDAVGKRELHDNVLQTADVIVADRIQICREVGELQYLSDAAGRQPIELADLVAGRATGRESPDQITLVDQCGLGVYDAAMIDAVLNVLGSKKL